MTTLVGISGSLRRQSLNTALLHAAVEFMPVGSKLDIADIHDIPLYNGDVEAQGIPAAVTALKERIVAADALLLVTPEYNNSVPGVMKNAIDWLSRPTDDIARVFHGRPVAVMGASPGPYGTLQAQTAWLPILRTLKMQPWFEGRLALSRATAAFNDKGELTDEKARGQLRQFVEGFVKFVAGAAD